jgi:hypothetical protein
MTAAPTAQELAALGADGLKQLARFGGDFGRAVQREIEIREGRARADSGGLVATVHPASEKTGWRNGVTTFDGDIMAWLRFFTRGPAVVRIVDGRRLQDMPD